MTHDDFHGLNMDDYNSQDQLNTNSVHEQYTLHHYPGDESDDDGGGSVETGSVAALQPDAPTFPTLDINHPVHVTNDQAISDVDEHGDQHIHEVFAGKSGESDGLVKGGIGVCGMQCLDGCTNITTESYQHATYAELSSHNS